MYRQTLLTIAAVVSLSACSKPEEASPQGSASASSVTTSVPTLLSCNGPVTKGATAAGILQSFGAQAREETIPGPEGTTQDAVVLYPDDPARKVVITFWDEAKTQLADVRAGRGAVAWGGPGHIRIGSPLKEVETANGKGFDLYGFEWDYGGYAADFKGGTLGALPGGCVLSLRFAPPEGHTAALGNDIVGDRQIASANANMQALQPVLVEMSIGWPSPDASVE
ncbi:MAG: hypothetical protein QM667_04350 [Asticcacaulis sp.]